MIKFLGRFKFFSLLFAWAYMNTHKPLAPRKYDKSILDKEKYIGKSIETILIDYPEANVISASRLSDSFHAEVRINGGTLLMQFVDSVCCEVDYFTDDEDTEE